LVEETDDFGAHLSFNNDGFRKENRERIAELRMSVQEQETKITRETCEIEMKPLILLMNSSQNLEMVYMILYGINKFTLLNNVSKLTKEQTKQFKAMEYRVDGKGDTTITLLEIKIRNIEEWDRHKSDITMSRTSKKS